MYLIETYKKLDTLIFFLCLITILISSNSVLGAPADSIIVKARHTEVQTNSIYEVYLSIAQTILPKAIIIVNFHESFDLSGVLIAGSTTINGGFNVSVEGSKVILKRSGLGRIIKPYEKVNVKFANVRNPDIPADNYKIKVEIKNEQEISILEKEETIIIIPHKKK